MQKLNYIHLINNFWSYYDRNKNEISTTDIVLYKILLRYCNKLGWKNPFTIDPFLFREISPLSINTYYKCLDNLNKHNLIIYKKGKHNVSNPEITIINFKNSINNSVENSIKNSIKNSVDNSLVNNNKTIKQLNNKTIKQLNEDDFKFLINSKEFQFFLQSENLSLTKNQKFAEGKATPEIFEFNYGNILPETWETWRTYKKNQHKFTFKEPKSEQIAINQIIKLSGDCNAKAIQIIENSIANGYKGLFELKNNNKNNSDKYRITEEKLKKQSEMTLAEKMAFPEY